MVVTPETEVKELNTSKGGGPTTLGLNNQMIDTGEVMVFTFVTTPDPNFIVPMLDSAEAGDEANIQFGGLNTIVGGSVAISQVQGGSLAALKLTAFDTDVETTGNGFIDGYIDDDPVAITSVTVIDDTGADIFTWTTAESGDLHGSVTVTFLDGMATITGIDDDYLIVYEAEGHQRLSVTGVSGKFDIGSIGLSGSDANQTSLSGKVFVEDDGPTAGITGNDMVLHDETSGVDALSDDQAGVARRRSPIWARCSVGR